MASDESAGSTAGTRTLWLVSLGFSLVCAIVILVLVSRARIATPPARPGTFPLHSQGQLAPLMKDYEARSKDQEWEAPIYIKTGVYIQSIEFLGPYNVRACGYIWQRYPKSAAPELRRGVVLPEADRQDFSVSYRIQQENEELIGWYFTANLRENFDYSRYPFDWQEVWFRLWYVDPERNVVLVPDFASYKSLDPRATPGLVGQGFVLEGWKIAQTYFSMKPVSYNTTFGMDDYSEQVDFPELSYNVLVRRDITTPLLCHGVAPVAVFVLVFVIFLMFSASQEKRGQFGLSWSGVIGAWSGSFFATLIAQSTLRGQLRAGGFVYLESLHILLYPTILAVACVATFCVAAPEIRLLQWRDNLAAKLLYWPVVTAVLLAVTLVAF